MFISNHHYFKNSQIWHKHAFKAIAYVSLQKNTLQCKMYSLNT